VVQDKLSEVDGEATFNFFKEYRKKISPT